MGWAYLTIAGLLEIGWIISLKQTAGFTRPLPIVAYALFGAGSAFFLSLAVKQVPLASAYIIWMGIGMVGAAVYGALRLGEPLGALRVISMVLILLGAVGIRVSEEAVAKGQREAAPPAAAAPPRAENLGLRAAGNDR